MVISQIVDYFNFQHFPRINILKTKQYEQLMPFCMYFKKHSCLLHSFNEQINLMSSSGLIASWARHYVRPPYKNDQMEPKAVNLDQIVGVIIVCICLITISLIVFILEVISTSHGTIKSVLDFFTFKAKQKHISAIIRRKLRSNAIKRNE